MVVLKAKVTKAYQICLLKTVRTLLDVKVGDYVCFRIENGIISIEKEDKND